MIKLTPRERNLLIFGIFLILTVSLIYWGILPAWSQYQQVKIELDEIKRSFAQAESIVSKETKYLGKQQAYYLAYDELKLHFFHDLGDNDAMLEFLSLIEEIAASSGVQIVSKTAQGITKKENNQMMKVNLSLKATTKQMTSLLLAVRNSQIAINIDRIRIDQDKQNHLLQLKLVLSTLLFVEEGDETGE